MATKETLIEAIRQSYALYFTHGARSSKKVDYFLDFKRIIMRKLILGIADGRVVCDNKTVFEASDIRVGLFQD